MPNNNKQASKAKTKNTRRRARKKRREPGGSQQVSQIQRSLKNTTISSRPMMSNPYLACRLDPTNSPGSMGIPDGRNRKFIVVDHFVADTITTVSTAGFMIVTLPTLPTTAAVTGLGAPGASDITVNGLAVGTGQIGAAGSPSYGWYPCGIPNEWLINAYPGNNVVEDPYQSASARLVSIKRRLFYMSQPLNATGVVSVTPMKVGITGGSLTNDTTSPVTPGKMILTVSKADNSAGLSVASVGTKILEMDLGVSPTVFTKDTLTTRVENAVEIPGKHYGEVFRILPTMDTPSGLAANFRMTADATLGSNIINFFTAKLNSGAGTSAYPTGVLWYDDDWECQQLVVTGMPAGSTFRWETTFCMEYSLQATSPFAPLAHRESVDAPETVRKVDKVINKLPVAFIGNTL